MYVSTLDVLWAFVSLTTQWSDIFLQLHTDTRSLHIPPLSHGSDAHSSIFKLPLLHPSVYRRYKYKIQYTIIGSNIKGFIRTEKRLFTAWCLVALIKSQSQLKFIEKGGTL